MMNLCAEYIYMCVLIAVICSLLSHTSKETLVDGNEFCRAPQLPSGKHTVNDASPVITDICFFREMRRIAKAKTMLVRFLRHLIVVVMSQIDLDGEVDVSLL